MKLQIKFNKERFPIDIESSATVKDLKRLIAKIKNCKVSQIRLIYIADILQNSQTLESVINDPDKPVHLFINELTPKQKKSDKKTQNQSTGNNSSNQEDQETNSTLNEFSQYVNNPHIRSLLNDPDVQNGLQMIRQGILICRNSGNTSYDHLLENIEFISSTEPYSPTPPPSSSPSASSLTTSSIQPTNTTKPAQTDQKESEQQPEVDYSTLYKDELQNMEEMGLLDKDINLKALIKFNGDLDDAVEWLIQQNYLKEQ